MLCDSAGDVSKGDDISSGRMLPRVHADDVSMCEPKCGRMLPCVHADDINMCEPKCGRMLPHVHANDVSMCEPKCGRMLPHVHADDVSMCELECGQMLPHVNAMMSAYVNPVMVGCCHVSLLVMLVEVSDYDVIDTHAESKS